jgi:HlyD family secretion protein
MTRKRKVWIGLGVVVVLGLMAANALRSDSGGAVDVRAEEVTTRDLVARVSATGHIEPETSVDITTDVAGRIVQLPVEEGQDVSEGDLLLMIDQAQYQAAVNQALAGLSQARATEAQMRASYIQAQRDAERYVALKERAPDLITDTEVEQAVTQADVQEALWRAAEHSVQQAQARLAQAQDQLAKTVIRAPMSGRVTRLNVERGETAIVGTMNNPGSLLLTVADLSTMEAVIEVDETDIPDIQVGDSASVEIDAFPNQRFSGRVTKIGNSSIIPRTNLTSAGSNQAIDFEVRITLDDPPEAVRPDLSATADVITATRENVLAIPIAALTLMDADDIEQVPSENVPPEEALDTSRDVEGVFVVDGDRARFRPVEVGIAGESYFEVLSGLEEGLVVVSGSFQAIRELEDGSRIDVTRSEEADSTSSAEGRLGDEPETLALAEAEARPRGGEAAVGAGAEAPQVDAAEVEAATLVVSVPPGLYAIAASSQQVGSVRNLSEALEDDGYPTLVVPRRDEANELWYRVMVGPYTTRAEVEDILLRLRRERGIQGWVREVAQEGSGTGAGDEP